MKPSGFVTIVAFIFGWLSGFMAISSSLPLMVIIPHFPELYGTTEKLPPKQILDIPINRTTAPLCAGLLVASLANTALSIGLSNRKQWARIPFAVEMALLTLLAARGLRIQIRDYIYMTDNYTFPFNLTNPGFIFTISLGIFCIWFSKHLLSPQVAAEFRKGDEADHAANLTRKPKNNAAEALRRMKHGG